MDETGGMRRVHLRGRDNILRRLLIQAVGFNLALMIRTKWGMGKPRSRGTGFDPILAVRIALVALHLWSGRRTTANSSRARPDVALVSLRVDAGENNTSATG